MKIKKILLGCIIVILAITACKKDDVILRDPQKFTRPINLNLPLFEISKRANKLFELLENTGDFVIDGEGNVFVNKGYTFGHTDTINLDFQNFFTVTTNVDNVEAFNMYIDFNNEFPIHLYAQLYVIDSSNTAIDSLIDEDIVLWKSPTINPDGSTSGPTHNPVDITLPQKKIKEYIEQDVKSFALKTNFSVTPSNPNDYFPDTLMLSKDNVLVMKLSMEFVGTE